MIPGIGQPIEVNYLVSDGVVGSIFRRTSNDWTFIESSFRWIWKFHRLALIFLMLISILI
jgi:hypothetical protein